MKILVTGAYGQLGRELKELEKQYPDFQFLFTDIDTLDISNETAVELYLKKYQPGFVINCAAYTAVDKAESEQDIARKVNATAPKLLAKYSNIFGSKFIHISTDYVFNGEANQPYSEEDKVEPLGVYGKTKLEGEKNCIAENPNTVIIRTSWLYSSFGNNFVKTMLRLGNERDEVKVVFDQIGTPTYAADLAKVIMTIVTKSDKNPDAFESGVYHFSNEGAISWYDLAQAIFEISEIDCKVNPVLSDQFPSVVKRPHYSVLNKSKIRSRFGVEVPYWKVSLKNCIEVLKKA